MSTNQQRREAAKRKLERQLVHRAERAKRRKIVGVGVVGGVVLIVAGAVVWFVNSSGDDSAAASPTSAPPTPAEVTIPTERAPMPKRSAPLPNPTTCDYKADTTSAAPKKVNLPEAANVPSTGTVKVTLKSTAGDIPLTLDRALAPCAVNSFLSLAKQNFYNDTMCHRLGATEAFQLLQCGDPAAKGDPQSDGQGGPGYTMPDEAFPEAKYGRGILAMAKTSAPNSGGSQFFMVNGKAELSPDYSIFGSISDEGLKVLDKVTKAGVNPATAGQDGTGLPNLQVKFTGVTVDG